MRNVSWTAFTLCSLLKERWLQCLLLSVVVLTMLASPVVPDKRSAPPSKRVWWWTQQNAIRIACMNNARNLAALVLRYSRDNQGYLPNLSSPAALQADLSRYTNDPRIFFCPLGQPYRGNASLAGKQVQAIENFSDRILLRESRRVHVGGRVEVLGDGRVVLR